MNNLTVNLNKDDSVSVSVEIMPSFNHANSVSVDECSIQYGIKRTTVAVASPGGR
jgi:hypothetical protein